MKLEVELDSKTQESIFRDMMNNASKLAYAKKQTNIDVYEVEIGMDLSRGYIRVMLYSEPDEYNECEREKELVYVPFKEVFGDVESILNAIEDKKQKEIKIEDGVARIKRLEKIKKEMEYKRTNFPSNPSNPETRRTVSMLLCSSEGMSHNNPIDEYYNWKKDIRLTTIKYFFDNNIIIPIDIETFNETLGRM